MPSAESSLLLLSGWTASGRSWDRFRPYVPGWKVLAPDNRETGSAGPCPEGFTIEDLARDALEAADRELGKTFTVVGHSMGGMIGQALAFIAPERVERLILVSTGPGASRGTAPDATALMMPAGLELPSDPEAAAKAMRAAFFAKFMAAGTPNREVIAAEEAERAHGHSADLDGLVRQLQALSAWDPPADLKDLELDISVVHGELDNLLPLPNGEAVAERAGVPLTVLPGVGHMVPWEAPEELARIIGGGDRS